MEKIRTPIIPLPYSSKDTSFKDELMVDIDNSDLIIKANNKESKLSDMAIRKLAADGFIHTYIYGFDINILSEDSEESVSYTDGCIGYTPLKINNEGTVEYGSWYTDITNFFGVRPCIVKDGEVVCYLDPKDNSRTIDGQAVDLTNKEIGNVMIEFKKRYYKFTATSTTLSFRVANYKIDDDYICDAFMSSTGMTELDKMYIAAYDSYNDNGILRSLPNHEASTFTIDTLMTAIENTEFGIYQNFNYAKFMYLVGLTWLVTKNRDSQYSIGYGRVDNTDTIDNHISKELFEWDGTNLTVFGIHNLWGNIPIITDGLVLYNNKIYYKIDGMSTDIQDYTYLCDFSSTEGWIDKYLVYKNSILIPGKVGSTASNSSFGTYFDSNTYVPDTMYYLLTSNGITSKILTSVSWMRFHNSNNINYGSRLTLTM